MELKYPNMRLELAEHLTRLSEQGPLDEAGWDEAIHFLFDDTHAASDAASLVGVFLLSDQEAHALSTVVDAIDRVLTLHGTDLTLERYREVSEWGAIKKSARSALLGLNPTPNGPVWSA